MILSYGLRLVCLCLVSFFAVNTVAGFAISFASGKAIRIAETMRPRSAARFLFLIRMLPFTLGAGVVLGLCVPSYLWLEPQAASERIGVVCLILALLGAASCAGSIARAVRAIATSVRCKRDWQQAGCEIGQRRLERDERSPIAHRFFGRDRDGPLGTRGAER